VEELGARVLNPCEKKERRKFSNSKVVCKSELGTVVLNPWDKKRKEKFNSSKVSRSKLGAVILNPWEKKERKKFSGSNDALPSHGVKPTRGFHKVKLRKVETW